MIPALVNNPLFRGITPERLFADLEEISFHTRSYKKGEILAQQGAVCNRLVILTKGSVRGEMIDYSGRLIKVEDIAEDAGGRRMRSTYVGSPKGRRT